jgi:hypothetical protein
MWKPEWDAKVEAFVKGGGTLIVRALTRNAMGVEDGGRGSDPQARGRRRQDLLCRRKGGRLSAAIQV